MEDGGEPSWKSASCFSLDYYRRFFDVDTEQVAFRIRSSFWPHKNQFLTQIEGKGDLYGAPPHLPLPFTPTR
jgi:hypothetical protein